MNRLPLGTRAKLLHVLVEGNSLRATTRVADVAYNSVLKLVSDAGKACAEYQNRVLRNLPCKHIQVDEIWAFCYAKQKNVEAAKRPVENVGDIWTWTAICADCKLVPSWLVGARDVEYASEFMQGLKQRLRMGLRRFTSLTNGFSKKAENHAYAVALHYMYHNFGRIHKTLRVTPAMQAGVTGHVWTLEEMAALMDANDTPKLRGPYEKKIQPKNSN